MAHLIFIHGISNKPEPDELLRIWRRTLGREDESGPGINLGSKGIGSSLIYWADVMYAAADPDVASHESAEMDAPTGVPNEDQIDLREAAESDAEAAWQKEMLEKYGIDPNEPMADAPVGPLEEDLERIPLPWAIKRPVMKLLVRDTHHYLFNKTYSPRPGVTYKVRDEIRSRFVAAVKAARQDGGPVVVLAHSQGTIVSYDCLKNISDCPPIDVLITAGSPLGLDEVQDKLAPGYSRADGFPADTVTGAWYNVYDRLDVVSRPDPKLANDFRKLGTKVVEDHAQKNRGLWRHSMIEYLSGAELRASVRKAFNL
ncbi:MAG: hypothetical protein AB8B47_01360 [Roseobacter sp.]